MVWGKNSPHTFGVSAFGISGFGVTFPQSNTNAINMPQSAGGFGRIQSDYQLMQVGFTYAYKVTEQFAVGIAPTFNYSSQNCRLTRFHLPAKHWDTRKR